MHAHSSARAHNHGGGHLIKFLELRTLREAPELFMSLPKVKKIQGCHCFQDRKLVDQQSEDHHNPVDASVDFEHIAFISDLEEWEMLGK